MTVEPEGAVPLFRFSTGHELWRVLDLELIWRWKNILVDQLRVDAGHANTEAAGFASGFYFSFLDKDLDLGVFALVRDGLPLRLLSLEEVDGQLQICLHPALPRHPDEDPTTGLQIFLWFSFRSFREPIFSAKLFEGWPDLGAGPVDWTIAFLVHDDTEIRTFLLAAMPWVLPAKRFVEWLDSSKPIGLVDTSGDNG